MTLMILECYIEMNIFGFVSTTTRWMSMTFGRDIHVTLITNNFSDLLCFAAK